MPVLVLPGFRGRLFTRVPAGAVLLFLLLASPLALAQFQLVPSPTEVTAGAEVRISGIGAPSGTLRVQLRNSAGQAVAQSATFVASAGRFTTSVNVPEALPAGVYGLQLVFADTNRTIGPSTPLTVLPALVLELPAQPLTLGAQFGFAVDGLRPGQLELRVDGRSIAGPYTVSGSRFEGFALLPVNVDASAGALRVEALNLLGDQRIGFASQRVLLSGTAPDAQPRVANLQVPGPQIRINAPWPVSGQLVLPRQSPAGLEARLFLRLPEGRMVPMSVARAPVAADGSFEVIGDLASLGRNGLLLPVGTTGDGFLVFVEPDRAGQGSPRNPRHHAFPLGPVVVQSPSSSPNPSFTVEVIDASGQPLADALVILDIPGRWKGSLGQPTTAAVMPEATTADGALAAPAPRSSGLALVSSDSLAFRYGTNQIRNALTAWQTPGSGVGGGQGCPETLQRGTTDENGRFVAELDREKLNFSANIYAINAGVSAEGNKGDIVHEPVQAEFRVLVNALPAGHTFGDSSLQPKGGEYFVVYNQGTETFFGWSEANNDYTVPLGRNPVLSFRTRFEYTGGAVYPLLVDLGGFPEAAPGRYGPTITFPDPVPYFVGGTQWLINVTTNESLFGAIDWMRLEYVRTGQVLQTWSFNRGSLSCSTDQDVNFRAFVDGARLPHSGPTGLQFRIRVKQQGLPVEQAFTYDFRLLTGPAPTWFTTTDLDQRQVFWSPDLVRMEGSKTRPQQAVSGTPTGAGVGTLSNRSQAIDSFTQSLSPGGLTGLFRTTTSSNRGANAEAAPATLSTAQVGITVPWGPETILDTGSLPLFRMIWGVPPIASATFGADARFWATLEIQARSDIDFETGVLSASVTTTPTVSGNITAFFNFSAVLGLVNMGASFAPEFSVAMPTTVTNNVAAQARECMTFRIWISYAVSVGLCPVCLEFSDEDDAFDPLVQPDGAAWCPRPPTPPRGQRTERQELLTSLASLRRPSASFDSLGAGSLIEVDGSGQLRERRWTGTGFGESQAVGGAVGADEAVQAHFAPGSAVMVYAASMLSESAFLASSFDQGVASRRLQFRRRLDNGAWSAASVVLPGSVPVGGEAKPALAACPKGQAGCALDGEVYAVWLRGTEPDPFSLATEVWGARYVNGQWQDARRLANPGLGSDQLPRVTYRNGQPVVSFVRQPARDLAAAGQRRLMLLRVGVDSQPIDTQAPDGVIWQDIGVNAQGEIVLAYTVADEGDAVLGDQHWLYAARGVCNPTCNFAHTRQRDGFGRDIMAESPQVLASSQGVQVAYRGLGYGPDAQGLRFRPGDSTGTIDGTGEFMSIAPHFSALGNSPPLAVSGNGALHFNPQLIRQPVTGALIGLSNTLSLAQAGSGGLASRLAFEPASGLAGARELSPGLSEFLLGQGTDLLIREASTEAAWAEPGESLVLSLRVENRGTRVAIPAALGVSWGGPWDSGVPQERVALPAFGDSGSIALELPVAVPPELPGRGPVLVYITLDPFAGLPDADRSNNLRLLDIGALPVPRDLRFLTAPNERHGVVEWEIDEDPRVRGFQVYREFAPGDWQPIGASDVQGFVDMMTLPGVDYRYRVASFDEDGAESDLSAPVTVQALRTNLIFQSRFERP